jgi:hypothetical protein
VFDNAGHLLSEAYTAGPLAGLTVTNQYDSLGRRTNLALMNAQNAAIYSVGYTYDPASRLLTVTSGDLSATYSYLANSPLVGQIVFQSNGQTRMTTTKSSDYLNRLTAITTVGGASSTSPTIAAFTYQYNSADQRTRATVAPDGSYWDYAFV